MIEQKITKILLGFDIFKCDNSTLQNSIDNLGNDFLIFSTDKELGEYVKGNYKSIQVPKFDGDIITKYMNYAISELGKTGTIVMCLPHFPFFKKEKLDECIDIFHKTKPSILLGMNEKGLDAEVVYIADSEHISASKTVFHDLSNSYVFMLDNVSSFKAFDPSKYKKAFNQGIQDTAYSVEKQKELAAKYQDNMKDYDKEFLENKEIDDPVVLRSSRDAPERIEKLVSLEKGPNILDLGCSSGNVSIRYARAAPEKSNILGVDIDEELIEKANEYLGKESEKVKRILKFVNKPVEEIDAAPESFDTIAATEFFEHIIHTEHDSLISNSLRFLKPEGSMIISVPNRFPKELYNLQKRYRWDWFNHYTHFTKRSLEVFLGKYFKKVVFHPVYNEKPEEGIFLIGEGIGKK